MPAIGVGRNFWNFGSHDFAALSSSTSRGRSGVKGRIVTAVVKLPARVSLSPVLRSGRVIYVGSTSASAWPGGGCGPRRDRGSTGPSASDPL